ncbi:MAG: 16S rRNA (cytosine(1402)-N(4))-methyltransferase RsmH [Bacilli bacterium]|nr:16S rRNA (cytosine(1402)-N(4))-methyltransferase RsmH [Bacilli bacterium]
MHKSVLLKETIKYLNLKETGTYVDCTLGYAGHSQEILKRITRGQLFAFDQDEIAIKYSQKKLNEIGDNFIIIKSNFINLKTELEKRKIKDVDGILFDLGVSSPQLDNDERGFSYHHNAKLDMRMDLDSDFTASDIVNNYSLERLIDIFYRYGEEPFSKSIAKNIVKYRENKKIETTLELVDIIKDSVSEKRKRETHPARQVFQALRIEVNKELEILAEALEQAFHMLKPGGRLCVITFHSLEDRICKSLFKKYSDIDNKVKGMPNIPDKYKPKGLLITKKPIIPTKEEIAQNNRARSAKLRVIEKI